MAGKKKTSSAGKKTPNASGRLQDLVNDFQIAVNTGQEKAWVSGVNDLLAQGADATIKTRHGKTLLHMAAEINDTRLIKRLLAKKADCNAADQQGETPLHLAALGDNLEAARALLAAGADLHAKHQHGHTPLHDAVTGKPDIAKLLIDKGANVHAKTAIGETPLHFAASYAATSETAALLIEKGAVIDEKDMAGKTPLVMAVEDGNPHMAAFLIKAGARTDITLADGNSLLHIASDGNIFSGFALCEILINAGIDPTRRNQAGDTALDHARKQNCGANIINLLEAAPAAFAAKKQAESKAAHSDNIKRLDRLMPARKRPK